LSYTSVPIVYIVLGGFSNC